MSLPRTNPKSHSLRLVDSPVDQRSIAYVDPREDPLWQRLVDRVDSNVFHSPAWMRVLAETYGFEMLAVILTDSGEPIAGIPYVRVDDLIGERIVTLPFSDYCDPLVANQEEWSLLSDELITRGCPVTVKCLHNDLPLEDPRFAVVNRAKWHGLDLTPDLEVLWQGLDEAARRAIRKAQKDGVVVRIANDEEAMRAFFDMHLHSRKYKYGLLAQPYRFFDNIRRLILEPGNGGLMLATLGGEVIAGTLYLEWNGRLFYKFNASVPAHLGHRPNDLLIWEGIRHAKEHRCGYLDFGLSDWDQEHLIQYKRKFARDEKTISAVRYSPLEEPRGREAETRALISRVVELLTDETVPDDITNRAGEFLYRFFV